VVSGFFRGTAPVVSITLDIELYLARSVDAQQQQQQGGLYVLLLFLVFNDSCVRSHYPLDYLCNIFRVGKTVAVDDKSEITFFDPSSFVAMATNFCWLYLQN